MGRVADLALLHPEMRERSEDLESALRRSGIPLRRFETWRAPRRQAALFYRGRVPGHGKPGKRVTFAKPWRSRHQYGLAEDWVFRIGRRWSWDEPERGQWESFTTLAQSCDLQTLNFERPHVQLPGIKVSDLIAGRYPEGGDDPWRLNLLAAIGAWGVESRKRHGIDLPGAPVPPPDEDDLDRPDAVVPDGIRYDEELGLCVPDAD